MDSVERNRIRVYGNYANSYVLKSPKANIKRSDNVSNNSNMLNNFQHRPRPTIYTNNQPTDNNIALYSREPNELMLNESMGNALYNKIKNNNKHKITTMNEDLLPNRGAKYSLTKFAYNDNNDNKNPYYPHLHVSQYNKIPDDIKPTMLDARMYQFTQEKEFNYESDQIQNAKNILKDQRRINRQNRQDDSIRTLRGLGHPLDNLTDNMLGYVNRPAVETQYILEENKKYNTTNETVYNTKNNSLNVNLYKIQRDSLDSLNQYYNMESVHANNNRAYDRNLPRVYNLERHETENHETEPKKGFLDTIFDKVKTLFNKEHETFNIKDERKLLLDDTHETNNNKYVGIESYTNHQHKLSEPTNYKIHSFSKYTLE